MKLTIHNDDAWKAVAKLDDDSIGALVTDPPYLINFMGNDWDKLDDNIAGNKDFWKLVMSKMKHGAHGVVFGHSRTHHRVMVALEDAGFEIRDTLMWLYGQGFPKNHNIGKSVDKLNNKKREVVGKGQHTNIHSFGKPEAYTGSDTAPDITKGTSQWEGWGTALKPAYEPIIMVRKPLAKGKTIAKNCASEGVGGINIDESRIGTTEDFSHLKPHQKHFRKDGAGYKGEEEHDHTQSDSWKEAKDKLQNLGRWPANILLSHHQDCEKECVDGCPVKTMDEQSGTSKTGASRYFKQLQDTAAPIIMVRKPLEKGSTIANNCLEHGVGGINIDESRISFENDAPNPATNPLYRAENDYKKPQDNGHNTSENTGFTNSTNPVSPTGRHPSNVIISGEAVDELNRQAPAAGGGHRAKSKVSGYGKSHGGTAAYEGAGENLDGLGGAARFFYQPKVGKKERNFGGGKNTHPTVKPVALMHYLVRLITPEGQCVLDPFMGSGATGMACALLDRDFIGIDMTEEWCDVSKERIEAVALDRDLAKKTFKIK